MSCWVVSKDHIDLLITAACAWELEIPENGTERGRQLWRENNRSVAYRYSHRDDLEPDDSDTYVFEPYPGRPDPYVVLNAANCYAYQSCEHPEWKESAAYTWSALLQNTAAGLVEVYEQRYGPIDVGLQPDRMREWYVSINTEGVREVRGGGWGVGDREVLLRVEKLRHVVELEPQ